MGGGRVLTETLLLIGAGALAGIVNSAVGSGSLITFTVLLSLGLPPFAANVTNSVAVLPGTLVGAWGYRDQLPTTGKTGLVVATATGAGAGCALLLTAPSSVFDAVVPYLVALGAVLVIAQPFIARGVRQAPTKGIHGPVLRGCLVVTGTYGAYLGAAQGVLLIGVIGLWQPDRLQRVNALKNLLNAVTNSICAVSFLLVAPVVWHAVPWIALGALLGAWLGARLAARLSDRLLRLAVVAVALVTVVQIL